MSLLIEKPKLDEVKEEGSGNPSPVFWCKSCNQMKPFPMFQSRKWKGVGRHEHPWCGDCEKERLEKDRLRKERREKSLVVKVKEPKRPKFCCPECQINRQQDVNSLCKQCNAKLGMRQCIKCRKLKLLHTEFEFRQSQYMFRCKDCPPRIFKVKRFKKKKKTKKTTP
jgi:hypothetical protein